MGSLLNKPRLGLDTHTPIQPFTFIFTLIYLCIKDSVLKLKSSIDMPMMLLSPLHLSITSLPRSSLTFDLTWTWTYMINTCTSLHYNHESYNKLKL